MGPSLDQLVKTRLKFEKLQRFAQFNKVCLVMRHARAHELQINGSAVYSFTVTRLKLVLVRLHGGVIYMELWRVYQLNYVISPREP